jgi:hypothetical protein
VSYTTDQKGNYCRKSTAWHTLFLNIEATNVVLLCLALCHSQEYEYSQLTLRRVRLLAASTHHVEGPLEHTLTYTYSYVTLDQMRAAQVKTDIGTNLVLDTATVLKENTQTVLPLCLQLHSPPSLTLALLRLLPCAQISPSSLQLHQGEKPSSKLHYGAISDRTWLSLRPLTPKSST